MPDQERPSLTVRELAAYLDPPMTSGQLGLLLRALGIRHVGTRDRAHTPGAPERTYDLGLVQDLHAAITPFLTGAWRPRE